MAESCCKLVGGLNVEAGEGCIISISMNSSTESSKIGDNIIVGPTIGTVSISGYASTEFHTGCPGRAGVSIPWIRKFDCDENEVYFIYAGAGKSFVYGDVGGLASLVASVGREYRMLNANISSGPATIYSDDVQEDGYGLRYIGGPISFTADDDSIPILENFGYGIGDMHMQNFSLELSPGNLPIASYSFVFGFAE